MSHTPTLSLTHYEKDEYPEPHSSDARLRGSDMLCYGILFGEIPQAKAMQSHIVHCVNVHDQLVEALKKFVRLCPSPEGLGGHAPMEAFYLVADEARQALAAAEKGA